MVRYSGDPRWITARFSSKCHCCNARLARGKKVYFWPLSHVVSCSKCGEREAARFVAEAQDEAMLSVDARYV